MPYKTILTAKLKTMKRVIGMAMLFCILLHIGCRKEDATVTDDKLIGTWQLTQVKAKNPDSVININTNAINLMLKFTDIWLKIENNGTFVTKNIAGTDSGYWILRNSELILTNYQNKIANATILSITTTELAAQSEADYLETGDSILLEQYYNKKF